MFSISTCLAWLYWLLITKLKNQLNGKQGGQYSGVSIGDRTALVNISKAQFERYDWRRWASLPDTAPADRKGHRTPPGSCQIAGPRCRCCSETRWQQEKNRRVKRQWERKHWRVEVASFHTTVLPPVTYMPLSSDVLWAKFNDAIFITF